jgi:hypothetical protein
MLYVQEKTVMNNEKRNPDIYLLVLGRPADPMCTILPSFLTQHRYFFSVCSSVYQVLDKRESICDFQRVILVSRPGMLISQSAVFLTRWFRSLQMVGWLDSHESLSDPVVAQAIGNGMMMVTDCEQLQNTIHNVCKNPPQEFPVSEVSNTELSAKIDPLKYELCDDEMNALLGVE